MATEDQMSVYDDDGTILPYALGGGALLGSGGAAYLHNASTKVKDAALRATVDSWEVTDKDIKDYKENRRSLYKELQDAHSRGASQSEIDLAQTNYDNADSSYKNALEKRELKNTVEASPDKSASKIQEKFIKDKAFSKTEAGKIYAKSKQEQADRLKYDKVDLDRHKKRKFPGKRVAALAATSGLMAGGGHKAFDYVQDKASDAADGFNDLSQYDEEDGLFSTLGNISDGIAHGSEIMGLTPGALSAAGAAGLAAGHYPGKIRDMYNVQNDPDGMRTGQALKQFGKDVGQATYDTAGKLKSGLGRGASALTTGGIFASDETKAKRAAKIAAREKELAERKEKRFRDPRYKEFERRNKKIDESGEQFQTEAEKTEARRLTEENRRNTAARKYIGDQMDVEVEKRFGTLLRLEKRIAAYDEGFPNADELAKKAALQVQADTLKKEMNDFKVLKETDLDLAMDDAEIKNHAQFKEYFGSGDKADPKAKAFAQFETAFDKAKGAAKGAADVASGAATKAADTAGNVINQGAEQGRNWWDKAKAKAGFSKGAAPAAGQSAAAVTPEAEVAKRGLLAKTVNNPLTNNRVTRGTAKAMSPGLMWNAADMLNQLYNSDDKEAYLKETGASLWDGLTEDAKEYKLMLSNGDIDDALLKFGQEVIVPGLEQSGKALYNVGALAGNAYLGDDTLPIASMEDRGFTTTIKDSMEQGGYHGDQSNTELMGSPYDYDPSVTSGQSGGGGGVSPPGHEGDPILDREVKAKEFRNAQLAQMKQAETLQNQRRFGGYDTGEQYADEVGVDYLNNDDGRYGDTPIYSSPVSNSFSDTPTGVGQSVYKEGAITPKDAVKLRDDYIKTEKSLRDQAQDAALPNYIKDMGINYDQFMAMSPTDKSEAYKQYGSSAHNKKLADRHTRNLDATKGLQNKDKEAYRDYNNQLMMSGQATQDDLTRVRGELVDARVNSGWKVPFMSTPGRYEIDPNQDDIPGVIFDDTPSDYIPDLNAYNYASGK